MLSDAKLLYDEGRMESAADRAYYAMTHAAHAALAALGEKAPRSHRALRSRFSEHLVKSGRIERGYSKDLTRAHEVRQESTYEGYASMAHEEVGEVVASAERFVERMKKLVAEEPA